MNAWRRWLPFLAGLLLLLGAVGSLFQIRLGSGDVYPEYSSLRADALGTRALYEALAEIPGLDVQRDYRPLPRLAARPRLVVLAGLEWQEWQTVPANELAALNAAAASGARVVLAFRADRKREDRDEQGRPVAMDDEKTPGEAAREKPEKKAEQKKRKPPGQREWERKELAKEWGVTMKLRWLIATRPEAAREETAPIELPAEVAWHSDLYFSTPAGSGWRVLYRRAGEPVLLEKPVGRGSLVLVADAYCLSNEAMQRHRATGLLAWLVDGHRQVVFLESALGVIEKNGVGFLARRYGLGGAVALCGLLGALYAWRRLVAFRPPQGSGSPEGEVALAYESAAGFTRLLRRSLGPAAVLPACVEEWRKGRRAGHHSAAAAARLEAAWAARDPQAPPAATYNALARALKPR